MAKKDIPSINYFKDKMRIADLLNVYLYDGNKIISPQDITELNPILAKSWWNDKKLKTNVNITDVLFEVKIPIEKDFREDVSAICNLSQKIKEAGIEIGKREMIMKMCDKGYTIAQIADVAGMDEKQIEDTIKMLNCYQYKRLNMI